jgi:hypothetical protein
MKSDLMKQLKNTYILRYANTFFQPLTLHEDVTLHVGHIWTYTTTVALPQYPWRPETNFPLVA